MKQTACPACGAPMWEGGRCPWDRGSGCVGRTLVYTPPRRSPVTAAPVRIATTPTPPRIGPLRQPLACWHCGKRFEPRATGRPQHFCLPAHRKAYWNAIHNARRGRLAA